jgi:hypothetical protein
MTASVPAMHQLAMRGLTDETAPARASGAIDVDASLERVFDALADVSQWPSFRGDVTDAASEGPAAPGRVFTWRANGALVTSRFAIVERPARLSWSNSAPGMVASCVYLFSATPSGGTRIRCEESMDASAIAPHMNDEVLGAGIASWLAGIKAHVEAEAAGSRIRGGHEES